MLIDVDIETAQRILVEMLKLEYRILDEELRKLHLEKESDNYRYEPIRKYQRTLSALDEVLSHYISAKDFNQFQRDIYLRSE